MAKSRPPQRLVGHRAGEANLSENGVGQGFLEEVTTELDLEG